MRRFGKYVVTALITFILGVASWFLTGGDWFSSRHTRVIQPAFIDVETRRPEIHSNVTGHGITSDGFETFLSEYQYSDGTYVHQLSTFYKSTERAHEELQKRVRQAASIVSRETVLDEKGRQIGERVVATFTPQNESAAPSVELLWTEHGRFVIQKRLSLSLRPTP